MSNRRLEPSGTTTVSVIALRELTEPPAEWGSRKDILRQGRLIALKGLDAEIVTQPYPYEQEKKYLAELRTAKVQTHVLDLTYEWVTIYCNEKSKVWITGERATDVFIQEDLNFDELIWELDNDMDDANNDAAGHSSAASDDGPGAKSGHSTETVSMYMFTSFEPSHPSFDASEKCSVM